MGRRKKKSNKKHEKIILKGFTAMHKVNKVFECEGMILHTNNQGGLVEMEPRIDDLYYRFYGQPIEIVLQELPTALWEWNVENNK
jgi:hypothetical protein